ncbi:heterotrimeric G-protein alpha subunit [Gelatoporia subvermispora B]|uniref:Heterotrimeric G-protein alpha subunit n=1 Tax=Ceriporiopsis subvermispora (strain B) TaxID=914234 RepID=M2R933_CERS8|nr:heterotrimeric G-protein alpha subunit [Gelatoporia subvermispora B]
MGRSIDEDPLSLAIAPPPNETTEEREVRLKAEAEARKISDRIDEQLKAERAALKKKKPIKVLLLGQSESGKSTTLKNFQIAYAKDAWTAERAAWRAVIQLNLVRNVNTILDMLAEEMSGGPVSRDEPEDTEDDEAPNAPTPAPAEAKPLQFTEKHALLKLRLAPLHRVQKDLEHRIGASSGEETFSSTPITTAAPFDFGSDPPPELPKKRHQEFFIRSTQSWKADVAADGLSKKNKAAQDRETTEIIAGCADDMQAVWKDPVVQEMLHRRKIRMELTGGFFLNDVSRIATRDYEPSDDDIVRARLRTLGVQEYKIRFEKQNGAEWSFYDVGGSRTQRIAWYPYFDDCDAIIFLAPINCFDERLVEDPRVNRLEDTYRLWKSVCSSKLLAKTQIILFLNKCDLLDKKLKNGVKVKDHIHTFGDRANNVDTVQRYFAQHFKEMFRRNSPEPRQFRFHLTSVVDTQATAVTLSVVEENILREHLRKLDLI